MRFTVNFCLSLRTEDWNHKCSSFIILGVTSILSDNLPYEKVGKNEPVCIADEVPFEIPESWEWVRLGTICTEMLVPQRDKPKSFGGNIPWCRIEDIEGKYLNGTQSNQYVSQTTVETMNLKVNPIGTVISANSASIGAAAICTVRCITNQTFIGLVCSSGLYNEYLYYFLKANVDTLKKLGTGTTISYISQDKYRKFMFPLPPLEEQKRIVARIIELEPLIDGYNKTYDHLTKLDVELPVKLKKSILQQAVMGKLVPQDPNDEPASVLLERIRAEKQALIKASKFKKDKHESIIYRRDNSHYEKLDGVERCIDEDLPFDIPSNWEWVRLFNLGDNINDAFADGPFGSNLKKEHYTDRKEVRLIQLSNIGEEGWRDENTKYTTYSHAETLSRSMVKPGAIVIAKMMPAGRAIIVPDCEKDYILSSDAVKFIPHNLLNVDYLVMAINSPVFRNQVVSEAHGVTRIRTSLGKLQTYLLPVPPLNEQRRIVARISELMLHCDEL